MQPKKATQWATLVDLPTEILLHIFRDINAKDLYSLSLLSRRLHEVALPLHLNCQGIGDFQVLKFATDSRSMNGLRGLRIATFIKSIKSIQYVAGDLSDPNRLIAALHEIGRLIRTPVLNLVEEVVLDFSNIAFWKRSEAGMVQMRTTVIEVMKWNMALGELLVALAHKKCSFLTIRHGGVLSSKAQDEDIVKLSQRQHKTTGNEPARYTFKRLLIDRSLTKLGGVIRPSNQKTSLEPTTHEMSREEYRFCALTSLKAFNLESFFLIHQPFLNWTIRTLNAAAIERLVIKDIEIRDEAWSILLLSLTMPCLTFLSITSNDLLFSDLIPFLMRLPTLETLVLCGGKLNATVAANSFSSLSLSKRFILPNLKDLRATPEYASRLMSMRPPPSKDPKLWIFPRLEFIGIIFNAELDSSGYSALDNVLARMSSHPFPPSNIRLLVEAPGDAYFFTWISATPSLGSLHCVRSLQVSLGYSRTEFDVSTMISHIPVWLGIFPALTEVELNISRLDNVAFEKRVDFGIDIQNRCPRLKHFRIGRMKLALEDWVQWVHT